MPNLAPGLLKAVIRRLGVNASAEEFLAYVAGVTAHHGYPARFTAELKTPGIRVPLTADPQLWSEAVSLGQRAVWLHTYGQQFTNPARGGSPGVPKLPADRRPKVIATIPDTPVGMPDSISYDGQGSAGPPGIGAKAMEAAKSLERSREELPGVWGAGCIEGGGGNWGGRPRPGDLRCLSSERGACNRPEPGSGWLAGWAPRRP